MASRSGSLRRPHRDNKAGRGDGMSLPDAPHIFLAAALSPNSFFEFSADVAPRPKGSRRKLLAGASPTPFPLARHVATS
ncbi:hypothetical protein MTO96_010385 [Rhipicephalus appendiculatus]